MTTTDDMRGGAFLAKGMRLEEFEIKGKDPLGAGGFGVTYLAHDTSLKRQVAIKEYLPHDWGARGPDGGVGPRSAAHEKDYEWGLERFLEEAQVLAGLHHAHVVQVYRVIEAWGTAYMVTEYVEGGSLASALASDGPWREARVLALLDALTAGLARVHAKGLIHRDIKPANVMLREDGSPVLIDFGAARQAVGGRSGLLTAVLTPGYAPFEQYNTKGRQGPWTDVYALGAVAYEALSGRVPEESSGRMEEDELPPVTAVAAHGLSSETAAAVMSALALRRQDRPQSLADWRALLGLGTTKPLPKKKNRLPPPVPPLPPEPPPAVPPVSGGDQACDDSSESQAVVWVLWILTVMLVAALVWAALIAPAFGQSKLDAGIERALSEIGIARVLVTMTAPKPGEASSAAYREPAVFVADLLGERGRNVQRIADLPVVVVETDRRGIAALVDSPHVALVVADEPGSVSAIALVRRRARVERAPASRRRKTSTPHPSPGSPARGGSSFGRARARWRCALVSLRSGFHRRWVRRRRFGPWAQASTWPRVGPDSASNACPD